MGKSGWNQRGGAQGRGNPNPRPRPTHFLCLPLVNEISIPQLVSSLEQFKAAIPLIDNPAASRARAAGLPDRIPLVPDGAHRPLGTLHLTLGVMSLPTRERLDEALNFLQSIDLVSIMREAEAQTAAARTTSSTTQQELDLTRPMAPLKINLASLHALPNARAATILHAEPIDPTSRLYPFCVILRNKFIEAGFIQQEMIKGSKGRKGPQEGGGEGEGEEAKADADSADELPVTGTVATTTHETESGVPRPLLLHATISNTVYLGGRWNQPGTEDSGRGPGRGGRGGGARGRGGKDGNYRKQTKSIYKFDATELISKFGGRSSAITGSTQSTLSHKAIPRNQPFQTEQETTAAVEAEQVTTSPFIWAQDVPLDRLCICQMGAKPVPYDELKGDPELGEEYTVIGQRRLGFSSASEQGL